MIKSKIYVLFFIALIIFLSILCMYFIKTNTPKKATIASIQENSEQDSKKLKKEPELEHIVVILNKKSEIKKDMAQPEQKSNEKIPNNEKQEENNEQNKSNNELNKSNNSIPQTNNSNSTIKDYYITVNYNKNVVNIFTHDENGNYTIPIKAMCCSTGTATPTSGKYSIKQKWTWLGLFGNVYGHYVTQINGNILFHSVPYTEKGNPASLEYWEYDKLRHHVFTRMC